MKTWIQKGLNKTFKDGLHKCLQKSRRPWAILSATLVAVLIIVAITPGVNLFHLYRYYNTEFGLNLDPGVSLYRSDNLLYPGIVVEASNTKGLEEVFNSFTYNLTPVRTQKNAIPRLFLEEIPQDIQDIQVVSQRKELFIRSILPLALKANANILKDRHKLIRMKEQADNGFTLTDGQQAWLEDLAARYRLKTVDMDKLMQRVDVIPTSQVLAQAIEESGWGTSRFAREGNALFGQQVFSNKVSALMPLDRALGKRHRVGAFQNLMHSVRSYMLNLNTHSAYKNFRQARAHLRANDHTLDSQRLIPHLTRYSERGEEYVRRLNGLIRSNRLKDFDTARLISPPATFSLAQALN